MAVMTKQQAKKFIEMDDYFIDLLDFLKEKKVLDQDNYRRILLCGYEFLVNYLKEKKVISERDAQKSMQEGYTYLVNALAREST